MGTCDRAGAQEMKNDLMHSVSCLCDVARLSFQNTVREGLCQKHVFLSYSVSVHLSAHVSLCLAVRLSI